MTQSMKYLPAKRKNILGKKNITKIYLAPTKRTNPIKYQKNRNLNLMKLGKISFVLFILFSTEFLSLNAEDKIISAPIINLENLEPSFENLDNEKV